MQQGVSTSFPNIVCSNLQNFSAIQQYSVIAQTFSQHNKTAAEISTAVANQTLLIKYCQANCTAERNHQRSRQTGRFFSTSSYATKSPSFYIDSSLLLNHAQQNMLQPETGSPFNLLPILKRNGRGNHHNTKLLGKVRVFFYIQFTHFYFRMLIRYRIQL